MSKRRARSSDPPSLTKARLSSLQEMLKEKIRCTDADGKVEHIAAMDAILKQLLKRSVSGNRRARRVLQGEGRASHPLEMALESALAAAGSAERKLNRCPLIIGSVLTVPEAVDFHTFCAQFERGLTDEEWTHYTRLAAIDFIRKSEAVSAKARADRHSRGAAARRRQTDQASPTTGADPDAQ